MTAPRFAYALLASALLGAPFVLAAHAAAALLTPLTKVTVGVLVRVTAPLNCAVTPATEAGLDASVPPMNDAAATLVLGATKPGARRPPKLLANTPAAPLFVSKETVLKLAGTAARPRGTFVQETPDHPAGLLLSGVGGLGIGVRDGDILVEALGITPRSPGQVVGAIIEARAKAPRFLSGTLWRQGKRLVITVEQPYMGSLPSRSPAAEKDDPNRAAP